MRINIVTAEDWVGLYINGQLFHQGHDIPTRVWLDLLQPDPDLRIEQTVPQDVMDEMGELPADLLDLQTEATDPNARVDLLARERRGGN